MKHEFITKWQKQLSESQRSEFELDVYKYLTSEQPKLNPIHQAYEEGGKIRKKDWEKHEWIMKYDENNYIDESGEIELKDDLYFRPDPKLWELYTEPKAQPEPAKPELNPIEKAYHERIKIRIKDWHKDQWIQKHSETEVIDECLRIWLKEIWSFTNHPELWELYTEPEATTSSQPEMTYYEKAKYIIDNKLTHKDALVKNCYAYYRDGDIFHFYDENWKLMFTQRFTTLDLSEWIPFQPKFDRNRFEAMFRAVVASGDVHSDEFFELTEALLQQLDAYYASKEGGKHE